MQVHFFVLSVVDPVDAKTGSTRTDGFQYIPNAII